MALSTLSSWRAATFPDVTAILWETDVQCNRPDPLHLLVPLLHVTPLVHPTLVSWSPPRHRAPASDSPTRTQHRLVHHTRHQDLGRYRPVTISRRVVAVRSDRYLSSFNRPRRTPWHSGRYSGSDYHCNATTVLVPLSLLPGAGRNQCFMGYLLRSRLGHPKEPWSVTERIDEV